MAQPVGERGEFGRWVDHFEANAGVHAQVDAAVDFDAQCRLTDEMRRPLIASVRRFQLGESGDGSSSRATRRAREISNTCKPSSFSSPRSSSTRRCCCGCSDIWAAQPMRSHWSDAIFVRLRRLMGLRTELMVLTVAEVVALSYYGGLAMAGPDSVVRAVAQRIVDDENAHVRFQRHRLHSGFADSPALLRLLAFGLWWVTAIGATVVVAPITASCSMRSATGAPGSSAMCSRTSPGWRRRS